MTRSWIYNIRKRIRCAISSIPSFWAHQIRILILVGAATGFFIQVTQIAMQYFSYQTRTQVYVQIPERAGYHNVALCVRFFNMMDMGRLKNETGIDLKNPLNFDQRLAIEGKTTIRQIFDYTPGTEDLFAACYYRTSDRIIQKVSGKKCSRLFRVTKYFTQEYICYKFQPLHTPVIKSHHVTKSQYYQYLMYRALLNGNFSKALVVNTIAFTGNFPFISRDFSQVTYLTTGYATGEDKKIVNMVELLPSDIMIKHLPPPFDTACRNVSFESMFVCKYKCLLKRYKSLGKMTTNEIIPDPIDYRVLGYTDLRNPEMQRIVSENENSCQEECNLKPCRQKYTKTSLSPSFFNGRVLGFNMRSPTEPDSVTEAVPAMSFVEFFSFLCSCFGTWFGVSFLTIDPFGNVSKKRKHGTKTGDRVVNLPRSRWMHVRNPAPAWIS